MEIITQAHKKFLVSLAESKVEFLLIGGYAVIYHGYPRFTNDMDIWLKPDNENKLKFIEVLRTYQILDEDLELIKELDFGGTHVFHIGEGKNKIDFLTKVQGLNFHEAYITREFFSLEKRNIPVINFEQLIVSKMLTDRPQDNADVDMLQKINRMRKK